ncbi:MAG: SMC family ATPase, partial [bacterium]|nr:SMC family ATPase [bacterium]
MIIKKLVLKNFGSYFKKTEINFPSSGFFLISGPTGSGKTTILEGISFALFGKVPRYEGMGRGLGSIISKNEDTKKSKSKLLEVELEFILNEQLYHLRRSVEFLLKGDEESAKNSEVEFRTDQKVLAVKPKEYEEIICKLLGMENIGSAYDTFTKSIFLPQNAFDRFLYLKPAERKNLVFELLNLNVYEKVKEKIKDEYSKLKASINTLEQQKELKQRNIQEEIEKISSFDNDQIMEFKSKVECSKEKILILRNILKNSILDLMKSTLELIQQMENIEFKDVDWGQYESEINDFCNTLSFNYQNFKLIYQRYVNIQREKQKLLNIRDENKKIVNLHNYFYIKEIFYDYNISDIRTNIIEIINDIKELQELDIKISQSEERIGKVEAELKNINYTLVKLSEILEKQYQQEEKFRTDLEELEQQIQQKKQKLDIKQSVLELQRVIHENKLEKCLVCSSQLIQENKSFIQSSLEKGKSSITQIIKEKEAKVEEIKKRLKEINSEIIKNQRKFTSLRSEKEQKEYQ